MSVSGVYAIFGPDKRVYVGQTKDILKRPTINLARRLGLNWSMLRLTPGATRIEREAHETRAHAILSAAGYNVVSLDIPAVTRRAQEALASGDGYQRRAEGLREFWSDPAHRAKQAERVRAVNARRTASDRSQSSLKGWETRRAQPCPKGQSKRTLSRRRAAAAGGIRQ